MLRVQHWLALPLIVATMAGCAAIPASPQNTPEAATPQAAETTAATTAATTIETTADNEVGQEAFEMRVVAEGLANPLELIYGPDDTLWLTERTGKRVVRVNPVDGAVTVALEIADAVQVASQDGVLGMVLHPELLQETGNDYVYLAYTYALEGGTSRQPNRRVKIVRYTYDEASETLGEPFELMTDLPGSGDHNSAKFVIAADNTLYYSIGDQGRNQFAGACLPNQAQELPTAEEVAASDWSKYQGKILRMNLDGSIPEDNPTLDGVQSHVYSYGHRNVQGLVMSEAGLLYGTEQGPKSDDEVNLLEAGMNYGWPHVAGFQDDLAYVYGNWSAAADCQQLEFSDFEIPESVPIAQESEWNHPDFVPPLLTWGTVAVDYDFHSPECVPQEWICWPTVAPTGMTIYEGQEQGVPGWKVSLLATALKTGTVYRMALSDDGRSLVGEAIPYFKTTNRYRDVAVGPDGRTFYVITDSANWTVGPDGIPTNELENPGAILAFTYIGE